MPKTRVPVKEKTKTKKVDAPPPINFEECLEKIQDFTKKNDHNYILVSYSEKNNYFILIQKQILTTKIVNNNSTFQPYECETTKIYPITFIVWISYGKDEPEFFKEIKKFNPKIIKLFPFDDFSEAITLALKK